MKYILVVGGAGYIGSHMCKYLARKGYVPVVLDSLITGHREAVKWGELFEGSMGDRELLKKVFSTYEIACVMHFAAYCYVGESVSKPFEYYRNNVAETLSLLESMREAHVNHFIFSSTCATYGEPVELPITENHPQVPINPYGHSKLMVEQILADGAQAYGLKYAALRYFNAAGADSGGELGEAHDPETHLIPLVLRTAAGMKSSLQIFGRDYPTADGTCVRDYIHVEDLAQAHLLAMEKLFSGVEGGCYNLGNGTGFSINQIVDVVRRVTGRNVAVEYAERRPGDPATLVGSSKKIREELGWKPNYTDIEDIIKTAWNWYQHHPDGYSEA